MSSDKDTTPNTEEAPLNFIHAAIEEDLANGRFDRVHTRFPPEPNGCLHIGHAKAIVIDHDTARKYGGKFNLRFDDTNPVKEEIEYVDSQKADMLWLGCPWDAQFYASDYFPQLYDYAIQMIKQGDAYVDHLSADEMREYRGTLTEPGKNSPYRDRSVEENLALFEQMKNGDFAEGECVLRAKIDMASPNMNLRDLAMYRILHQEHHQTGNEWCIYPMYDWAHGQSDSIEGITHSFCDLGYEIHRPLYEWFLEKLGIFAPRQIEFARLNITNTVLSKRRLIRLVQEGHVTGWDDPRMPTLAGMRRRGYTTVGIRAFLEKVGVAKTNSTVEYALLESQMRDDLNKTSNRVMGVLDPLKVVITNYPEGQTEQMDAVNNPEDESAGKRQVPFSRELYIERADFMEDPPRKFFRLSPGREVRLRYAYFVTCTDVIKDDGGQVIELHCTYDPATRGGDAPDGRKVKATLHWVSVEHALEVEVRLYDHLLLEPDQMSNPPDSDNFMDFLNPESLVTTTAYVEPSVKNAEPGTRYQFERMGYFCVDTDSTADKMVFNRTVTLRDKWAKIKKRHGNRKQGKGKGKKKKK